MFAGCHAPDAQRHPCVELTEVIFAFPVGGGAGQDQLGRGLAWLLVARPEEPASVRSAAVEVFQLQAVLPGAQRHRRRLEAQRVDAVMIECNFVVDEQSRAIVRAEEESIVARLPDAESPGPTHKETILQ